MTSLYEDLEEESAGAAGASETAVAPAPAAAPATTAAPTNAVSPAEGTTDAETKLGATSQPADSNAAIAAVGEDAASPAQSTIFVGGIAWETTDAGLKMYFEEFGTVKNIDLKRGFAFVHFDESEAVSKCMEQGREHWIDGKRVEVKVSESKSNLLNGGAAVDHNQPTMNHPPPAFHHSPPQFQSNPSSQPYGGGFNDGGEGMGGQPRDAPGMNVGRKVFVGGLSQEVRQVDLKEMMQHHGIIEDVVVMMDRYTKRSRGFGFVTFSTQEEAQNACRERRQDLGGKMCEVKLYQPGEKTSNFGQQGRPGGYGPPQHDGYGGPPVLYGPPGGWGPRGGRGGYFPRGGWHHPGPVWGNGPPPYPPYGQYGGLQPMPRGYPGMGGPPHAGGEMMMDGGAPPSGDGAALPPMDGTEVAPGGGEDAGGEGDENKRARRSEDRSDRRRRGGGFRGSRNGGGERRRRRSRSRSRGSSRRRS